MYPVTVQMAVAKPCAPNSSFRTIQENSSRPRKRILNFSFADENGLACLVVRMGVKGESRGQGI